MLVKRLRMLENTPECYRAPRHPSSPSTRTESTHIPSKSFPIPLNLLPAGLLHPSQILSNPRSRHPLHLRLTPTPRTKCFTPPK
ncbi:hypothetical protein BOTBODRAFT_288782 [Botryobasidium botryosum FD-172 SS1]|uniref:Uncharacterized protein n=1 Tax=Botryobasidium botryosum (strain FD-172 SS1) TaxID=930990 RepID=A0A067M2R8_BOTB1|nr:hypothetical protein BOTBODRAFT_288782 [Botryobasidium botryosum FD-172 SS1]